MKEKNIIKKSLGGNQASKTDWSRFDAITDEEIRAAIADDPDAAPILDKEWFIKAELKPPVKKEHISIKLDADILAFFRIQGAGYQTRINNVLRAYIEGVTGVKR